MAREYAKVKVAVWADTGFRELTTEAQHLYFVLLTSPTLNLCGVADWRPKRLAMLAATTTPDDIIEAATELADRRYVVVDEASEEVLVRSFVRHDGVMKGPNTAVALAKDFAGVASPTIRGVIVHELRRLLEDEPGVKGSGAVRDVIAEPSLNPYEIEPFKAIGNPSGKGIGKVSTIPQPSTKASNPHPPATPPREDVDHLCTLLADLIEANGSKRPTITAKWRTDARLLLDKDQRPPAEADWLLRWCQADPFWKSNVLSMPTFREKYDQLRLKARSTPQAAAVSSGPVELNPWRLR